MSVTRKHYVFNDPSDEELRPIANCAFCGLPATYKATDNTPLCKDCAMYYKAEETKNRP
jgi:hypothetical protein